MCGRVLLGNPIRNSQFDIRNCPLPALCLSPSSPLSVFNWPQLSQPAACCPLPASSIPPSRRTAESAFGGNRRTPLRVLEFLSAEFLSTTEPPNLRTAERSFEFLSHWLGKIRHSILRRSHSSPLPPYGIRRSFRIPHSASRTQAVLSSPRTFVHLCSPRGVDQKKMRGFSGLRGRPHAALALSKEC
jgi:hypothetical protein